MAVINEAMANYYETMAGQKGYNYYNLPGIEGQGYGFEELPEKEQPTSLQLYKGLCKIQAQEKKDKEEKEKNRTCHSNKIFECIYCDEKGQKKKINTHIFKKHVIDIRADLVKLLETRKKIIAPISMNFRKGKKIYFCLLCNKHWYCEGDAIVHNSLGVCKIEDQVDAIYEYVAGEGNPKVPREEMQIENTVKTKTEKEAEQRKIRKANKKLVKEIERADTLEGQVEDINNKLLIQQVKKLKEQKEELEKQIVEYKKSVEKPKTERLYHETRHSIYKQRYIDIIENIIVSYLKKDAYPLITKLLRGVDISESDYNKLTYMRKAANMGEEPAFKIGVDFTKMDLKEPDRGCLDGGE